MGILALKLFRRRQSNKKEVVIMRFAVIFILYLTITGCAASTAELRALSSGKIGCPENTITIENSSVGMKTASWTVKCKGKTYFCAGDDMLRGVTCKEEVK